jgi:hypothetical protein
MERPLPGEKRPLLGLFLFFPRFFAAAFACQGFLGAPFFAGLQVEGVPLDLLDDVFLLHFALETAQGIFQRLALLYSDFRQTEYTPNLVPVGPL